MRFRIKYTIISFVFVLFLIFLYFIWIFGEAEELKKENKKPRRKDSEVISKSVFIGYSNSDNLTIFSAYSNDEQITVILSSYGYFNRRVYCRLFNSEKMEIFNEPTVVFPEFTAKCRARQEAKFITISLNKRDNISSFHEITILNEKPAKSELSICLAPIFGTTPKILMLIEFLEYYKIQGADNFLIYIYESNAELVKLLEMYATDGNLEIINIGNNTKCLNRHRCRHEMQLQDCVHRLQRKAKWVATVDLDERIMVVDEALKLVDFVRTRDAHNVGEFRFRCQWTLRYSENINDSEVFSINNISDVLPMIIWKNTSHVAPMNHTTKSIIRPEMVDSMGVHGVQKFVSPRQMVDLIDFKLAVVRHYRLVKGWSFFLNEAETFGNFSNYQLSASLKTLIVKNVSQMLKKYRNTFK